MKCSLGISNFLEVISSLSHSISHSEHSREKLSHVRGQGQKPGGPHARGAAAERSYPTPEARGGSREEQPHVQGAVAARAQESLEELFHIKVRRGGGEEIPLVQGKRNPNKTVGVARGHQRADTLKP